MLGVALAAQALACAYYGIFAGLLVGYAAIVLAIHERTLAGLEILACDCDRCRGLARLRAPLLSAVRSPAAGGRNPSHPRGERSLFRQPSSYLASPAHAHGWLLAIIQDWPRFNEVLFPGFLALTLAAVGLFAGIRRGWDTRSGTPATRETGPDIWNDRPSRLLGVIRPCGGTLFTPLLHDSAVLVPASALSARSRCHDGACRSGSRWRAAIARAAHRRGVRRSPPWHSRSSRCWN